MTGLLRAPGEAQVIPIKSSPELKVGYGMCDTDGHHGYSWIVAPTEIVKGVMYGKCAKCAGTV